MNKQQSSTRKQHLLRFKAFVEQCYVPKKQTKSSSGEHRLVGARPMIESSHLVMDHFE